MPVITFYDSFHCRSQIHCPTCRWDSEEGHKWRESVAKYYDVSRVDFECPRGKPWEKELKQPVAPAKSRGLGDTVAKAIHKVSRGKIKPCGGCKKRQAVLNRLVPCGRNAAMFSRVVLLRRRN